MASQNFEKGHHITWNLQRVKLRLFAIPNLELVIKSEPRNSKQSVSTELEIESQ